MTKKKNPFVKWNTTNEVSKTSCAESSDFNPRENPDLVQESDGMYYAINQVPEETRKIFTLCEQVLTPKQHKIINLMFRRNYNQKEVAKYMHISQQMVSKHYTRAINKLRGRLVNEKTNI